MASVPSTSFKNEGKTRMLSLTYIMRIRPFVIDERSTNRSPPTPFHLTMLAVRVLSFFFGIFFLSFSHICFHNSVLSSSCSFSPLELLESSTVRAATAIDAGAGIEAGASITIVITISLPLQLFIIYFFYHSSLSIYSFFHIYIDFILL